MVFRFWNAPWYREVAPTLSYTSTILKSQLINNEKFKLIFFKAPRMRSMNLILSNLIIKFLWFWCDNFRRPYFSWISWVTQNRERSNSKRSSNRYRIQADCRASISFYRFWFRITMHFPSEFALKMSTSNEMHNSAFTHILHWDNTMLSAIRWSIRP